MIKAGIIGYGKMGRIRAEALKQSGRAEVTEVYDVHANASDVTFVASAEQLIQSNDIDAVFVCTPNHLICPLIISSLNARKHVFAEKPPGLNAEEVRSIRAVEVASGRVLMYGFNHRHHESIKRMKEIVDSGELGRILWMRGRYGKEVDESFFKGWRADPKLAGGGIMLDQGIHMLDLMLHLGGGFDEVHAVVSNLFWKIEGIEDNVFAILKSNESGICASLHSTMTQWRYLFSLEVFLEKGSLIINGLKTSSNAYGEEKLSIKRNASDGHFTSEEHNVFHVDTSWNSEIEHFLGCVETGSEVMYGSSTDALKLMQLMDRIYEASA
ncbi:putative dehydrogenase [Rhodopirellula rubra]|uniref:Putative dehydrogenase n=1 Tax=Aporhodopirellula rubra TaxID=980271 RepID=A0A7W5H5I4_9BACT|nr:Gfo/Idh/MocA family oxidoreductase [Aporhodopirellula rubra]MBB3206273.1 putative dehydrogenase [Aporhodopirellula rubra]